MQLDGLSLMVAGCFVATFGGLILIGAWAEMRGTRALLWWGGGHLVNTIGAASFAVGLATGNALAATLGAGGIVVSMTLYWAGTRAFFHRRPLAWPVVTGILVWALVTLFTLPMGSHPSLGAFALLTALIMSAAGGELAIARDDRLRARWPLVAVFALHACFMLVGFVEFVLGNLTIDATPEVTSWFGLVHFERLIFLVGSTVFMIGLARERKELVSATAAYVDSLTGVANRGAFFTRAERLYRRTRQAASPIALIVFDLDHFKDINDTHGHLVGDRVLKAFAETVGEVLRPGDLFGRIGGEEFAAILPGAGAEAACVVAERVRHAFELAPKSAGETEIRATVSAGVASAGASTKLETTLEAADRALYRAKAGGRNRVERAAELAAEANAARVA
jgi:diguanylate cyclase (GGDEF)-like protein